MTKTYRQIEDDELRRYHEANPWVMVNAQVRGQLCGREPTRDQAIERARLQGGLAWVDDDAKTVGFNGGCFC